MERKALIERKTKETVISLNISLDGQGDSSINSGIGFFDHMLELFAKHGLFNVELNAKGDLEVDFHHTVEDTGIVLGQAVKKALGDKAGIIRYGTAFVPMDESLAMVSLDLSSRPYLVFDMPGLPEKVGDMDTELFEEFFRAVSIHAGINLHIKVHYGSNGHHMIEAVFKAFAQALDKAVQKDERIIGVLSTKGTLE